MELSSEDRERIYQEEKARHEARELLNRPKRRRTLKILMWVAAIPLTYIAFQFGTGISQAIAQRELRGNPEAIQYYRMAQQEMSASRDVIRIGELRNFE